MPVRAQAPAQAPATTRGSVPSQARPAQRVQETTVADSELSRRRQDLAAEYARLHWDLAGLTYEMAIRDHFRLDLLVRHAARLQQVDADLGAIEQMLRLEQAGAAGECPSCRALYPRGAVFCSQCGADLVGRVTLSTPTAVA